MQRAMMQTYHSMTDAYRGAIVHLLSAAQCNQWVKARGMEFVELDNYGFVLLDPVASAVLCSQRRQNKVFGAIERLSYLSGHGADPSVLVHYNSKYKAFVGRQGVDEGAYGPRVLSQLAAAYRVLSDDRCSRRATVGVWDTHFDTARLSRWDANVPCTLALQFVARDDRLYLTAVMRSNDAMLGLTYDAEAFCLLQQVMARWLGLGLGAYTHFDVSLHLYKEDVDLAQRILGDAGTNQSLALPPWDGPTDVDRTYEMLGSFWDMERLSRAAVALGDCPDVTGELVSMRVAGECEYLGQVLKWVSDYNSRKAGVHP